MMRPSLYFIALIFLACKPIENSSEIQSGPTSSTVTTPELQENEETEFSSDGRIIFHLTDLEEQEFNFLDCFFTKVEDVDATTGEAISFIEATEELANAEDLDEVLVDAAIDTIGNQFTRIDWQNTWIVGGMLSRLAMVGRVAPRLTRAAGNTVRLLPRISRLPFIRTAVKIGSMQVTSATRNALLAGSQRMGLSTALYKLSIPVKAGAGVVSALQGPVLIATGLLSALLIPLSCMERNMTIEQKAFIYYRHQCVVDPEYSDEYYEGSSSSTNLNNQEYLEVLNEIGDASFSSLEVSVGNEVDTGPADINASSSTGNTISVDGGLHGQPLLTTNATSECVCRNLYGTSCDLVDTSVGASASLFVPAHLENMLQKPDEILEVSLHYDKSRNSKLSCSMTKKIHILRSDDPNNPTAGTGEKIVRGFVSDPESCLDLISEL